MPSTISSRLLAGPQTSRTDRMLPQRFPGSLDVVRSKRLQTLHPQEMFATQTGNMPSIMGLLTGRAGSQFYPHIDGEFVAKFLNQLGILSPQVKAPIDREHLTTEFLREILTRITDRSKEHKVIIPLASLFAADNGLPSAERLQLVHAEGQDGLTGEQSDQLEFAISDVNRLLALCAGKAPETDRIIRCFGVPKDLSCNDPDFRVQTVVTMSPHIIYQSINGPWMVWKNSVIKTALTEIAIAYNGNKPKARIKLDLSPARFGINRGGNSSPEIRDGLSDDVLYLIQEIISNDEIMARYQMMPEHKESVNQHVKLTGKALKEQGLQVDLGEKYRWKHFAVYATPN